MKIFISEKYSRHPFNPAILAYKIGSQIKSDFSQPIPELETVGTNIEYSVSIIKHFGWKTSRYQPSNVALRNRMISHGILRNIHPAVDHGNKLSLLTGLPIGIYDYDRIQGDITIDIGDSEETMDTLGKGILRIGNCLIARDLLGAFGSVISDSRRTAISESTSNALVIAYCVPHSGMISLIETIEINSNSFISRLNTHEQ